MLVALSAFVVGFVLFMPFVWFDRRFRELAALLLLTDVLYDGVRAFAARLLRRSQLLTELCNADLGWCDSGPRRNRLLHDSAGETGRRSAR